MGLISVRLRNKASGVVSAPRVVGYEVPAVDHGRRLTRAMVGPQGRLTTVGAVTTTRDGQVIQGLRIDGGLDVRHNVLLEDCEILGQPGASGANYTIKHQRQLGRTLTMRRCRVVTRSGMTKGMASWGPGFTVAEDCEFLGGTDNVYLKPSQPAADGGPAHRFVRCWFGNLQKISGSHSDCLQVDGGTGGVLLDRCSLNALYVPDGQDPAGADAPSESLTSLANAALILTALSSAPELISNVTVESCHFDGGNWTVNIAPPDGPTPTNVRLSDCTVGLHHRYGPLRYAPSHVVDCRWAYSGTTTTGRAVTAGQTVG